MMNHNNECLTDDELRELLATVFTAIHGELGDAHRDRIEGAIMERGMLCATGGCQ